MFSNIYGNTSNNQIYYQQNNKYSQILTVLTKCQMLSLKIIFLLLKKNKQQRLDKFLQNMIHFYNNQQSPVHRQVSSLT